MSTSISRRTFTWKCWFDGVLRDVVVCPPAKEEKTLRIGGIPGRLYNRQGTSLQTITGVVHQDAEGRTYFLPN